MLRFLVLTTFAAMVLARRLEPQPRYLEDSAEERVVGGQVAAPNSWPWQISLQWWSGSAWRHTCGGSLIATSWVMTAAHCVDSPREWRVVVGEHDLNVDSGREQVFSVSRVYIHPKWNAGSLGSGWDMALLRLSADAELNQYAQLASLPPSEQILPHDNECYITGWGRTATGGSISYQLKEAYLPVVGRPTCTKPDWWGGYLATNLVCAGGAANAGCNGDSGGPLNCKVEGRWVVHGVTSFVSSMGCDTPKKPTVFSRVSAYIEWMDSIMV